MLTERSVVGWNSSRPSERALQWAVEHERKRGGKVLIVGVAEDPGADFSGFFTTDDLVGTEIAVNAEAERIRKTVPDITVSTEVVVGHPLEQLRRYTSPESLLVVGTREHTRPHLRFGWSLSIRLAGSAHGPVAIVPVGVSGNRSGVVAGVDSSEVSIQAALCGAEEAERRDESLCLINAATQPVVWREPFILDPGWIAESQETQKRMLAEVANLVQVEFPSVRIRTEAVMGEPSQALLQHAPLPSLVVVGCRGRSAFARALLGSVSHAVLINMDVPVIVISDDQGDQQEENHSLIHAATKE